MGTPAEVELSDFRRRVADLYYEVRDAGTSSVSWRAWRKQRDALFAAHPCSPLAGSDLESLPFWPYDRSWRLTGTVEAEDGPGLSIESSPGKVERFDRIGRVFFARLERQFSLPIYWSEGYSGGLFLPFRDLTSGTGTFGSGRYLLDGAKSADLGQNAAGLILDFNFSYHPSCVWGDWLCPLPSEDAKLDIEVTVGEQRPDSG